MRSKILSHILRQGLFWALSFAFLPSLRAERDVFFYQEGDTITIGNKEIERTFLSTPLGLRTLEVRLKETGKVIAQGPQDGVDVLFWSKLTPKATKTPEIHHAFVTEDGVSLAHLKVEATAHLEGLDIKRVLSVYEGVAAIRSEVYVRGTAPERWSVLQGGSLEAVESLTALSSGSFSPTLERYRLQGNHHKVEAVELFDVTDENNTLVRTVDALTYKTLNLRGNLLFASSLEDGSGLFILREAPVSSVELSPVGADFRFTDPRSMEALSTGLLPEDITGDDYQKCYGTVTGVFPEQDPQAYLTLHRYEKALRGAMSARDEMIMMNTWGDRGRDTKVGEKFCIEEIEMCQRLGVTHFQIDDGWQKGKSANSAYGGSFNDIWKDPEYWTPDPGKYPQGLGPVMRRARELGVEVGLWFNPSKQDAYKDYEKDAGAVLRLFREYGIRYFKIDGVDIPDKTAENRFRKFLDIVQKESGGQIVFNLDATAQRRGSYFQFSSYGNIFLENRYTDWGNYYPYRTLRNLWMLSRYIRPQRLQIELLNNRRNPDKYPTDDPFAPKNYSMEYLLAITMVAQPLFWMEAHNLQEEDFQLGELVRSYRKVMPELHQGEILPIGDEPDGKSWTGFQSMTSKDEGLLLIYREDNGKASHKMGVHLKEGSTVNLRDALNENAPSINQKVTDGKIQVEIPDRNGFRLLRYRIQE